MPLRSQTAAGTAAEAAEPPAEDVEEAAGVTEEAMAQPEATQEDAVNAVHDQEEPVGTATEGPAEKQARAGAKKTGKKVDESKKPRKVEESTESDS